MISTCGRCLPPRSIRASRARRRGIHRASPIGATYDAFGSERYVLTFNNRAMRDIAAFAPYEFVEILTNTRTYGGGGIFGLYGTVAADSEQAPYVFVHEFAHHFAALADEYYTSPVAYAPAPASARVEPWEPNVTALLDPSTLKWRDLVEPGTPLPTPWQKDAFEKASRAYQERRAKIRADKRPEEEMEALFREAREFEQQLFARRSTRQGRRLRGSQLRSKGLLPARSRLHHVHAQPGVLRRVPAGNRDRDLSVHLRPLPHLPDPRHPGHPPHYCVVAPVTFRFASKKSNTFGRLGTTMSRWLPPGTSM